MPALDSRPAPLSLDPDDLLEPVATIFERVCGRRPSPATIWRLCSRGTKRAGIIPSQVVFGQRHSTEAAVRAWIARGSEPAPAADADDSTAERDEATDRRLRAAGLLE